MNYSHMSLNSSADTERYIVSNVFISTVVAVRHRFQYSVISSNFIDSGCSFAKKLRLFGIYELNYLFMICLTIMGVLDIDFWTLSIHVVLSLYSTRNSVCVG